MEEKELPDGRKELLLKTSTATQTPSNGTTTASQSTVNNVTAEAKISLQKRKMPTARADEFSHWLNTMKEDNHALHNGGLEANREREESRRTEDRKDNAALYKEPPFLPSEKRRLYFGPETPVLAPLTTQGNLPFRALCVSLGAELTYSEMAMSMPLIQGSKSEWALMRAHASEALRPAPSALADVSIPGYDNAKDLRFGAQIAGNKPYFTLKATEVLTALCPHLRVVDLNCGCPIDLVYQQGAGSALLDNPARLERMLYGMGAVSGEVPVSVKIRMGTKDSRPTAQRLVSRLAHGEGSALPPAIGSCGVAAITLHGHSRQQRYTRARSRRVGRSTFSATATATRTKTTTTTWTKPAWTLSWWRAARWSSRGSSRRSRRGSIWTRRRRSGSSWWSASCALDCARGGRMSAASG